MNFVDTGFVDDGYFVRDTDTQGQVRFDGLGKKAYLSEAASAFTTTDIYSRWADWVVQDGNTKWPQAMRTVGNDPIPGGLTGLFLFLQNGWQIVTARNVVLDGIVYHDDGIPVFDIRPGGGVTNKVAALAYGVNTAGGGGATAAELWAYPTRLVTNTFPVAPTPPTTSAIAAEVRAALAVELARLDVRVGTRASQADVFAS